MAANPLRFKKHFKSDPEQTVEQQLKKGILRAYHAFMDQAQERPQAILNVQRSTIMALAILTNIQSTLDQPKRSRTGRQEALGPRYISSIEGLLVEFFHDNEIDEVDVRGLHSPERVFGSTPDHNEMLQQKMLESLEAYASDDVQTTIFRGVIHLLGAATDFAGPFLATFHEQQPLFSKLQKIYESHDRAELDLDIGCYNPALAVDVALAREDRSWEEDVFGDMWQASASNA